MPDDARISTAIRNHPKTRKLQKRLGRDAVLSLIWLFLYAAESQPDGDLSAMSVEDIEIAADWDGAEGELVAALSEVRFLDGEVGSYTIHDWQVHNPWVAGREVRQKAAKQAASKKWGSGLMSELEQQNRKKRSDRMAEARRKGTHTKLQWEGLVGVCGLKCVRCGNDDDSQIVKDHIVPIYQGGSDGIENIQPLCRTCNSSKGPEDVDFRPKDWKERLPDFMERLRNACATPAQTEKTPPPLLSTPFLSLPQNTKTSSDADASVDERHSPVRVQIQKTYEEKFGGKCPWDGSEAKALKNLLSANPSWASDDIGRMVENRFASEGINGTRPRVWIPRLSDYIAGPLDRFNKLISEGKHYGNKPDVYEQIRKAREANSVV